MLNFKPISFHPKLAAVLDLFVNLIMLGWIKQLSAWWMVGVWLFFRAAIWLAFMLVVYYSKEMSRVKHLLSLVAMSFGAMAFLLFIEWNFAWYLFGAFFSFFSFFSFWLLPSSSVSLSVFLKPHLRWRFIMSIIGLAGIFTGSQAIISFQIVPGVNSLVWFLLAAFFAAVFAGWWWWEYGAALNKRFFVWVGLWFVLMLELLWVVNLLPLGYLISSLILIWCWYMAWLMARFNLTAEGIVWKKQLWFLGANLVLFISFLIFVVRWR